MRLVISSEASTKIARVLEVDPARTNDADASSTLANLATALRAAAMTSTAANKTVESSSTEHEWTRAAAAVNATQSAATHAATSQRASQSSTTCVGMDASRPIAAFISSRPAFVSSGPPTDPSSPPFRRFPDFLPRFPDTVASSFVGPTSDQATSSRAQNFAASSRASRHLDHATSSVSSPARAPTSSTIDVAIAPNDVAAQTPSHAPTTPRTASRVHSLSSRGFRNTSSPPSRTHSRSAAGDAYAIHTSWHVRIRSRTASAVGVRRRDPARAAQTATSARASSMASWSETPAGGGSATLASWTTRCRAAPAAAVALDLAAAAPYGPSSFALSHSRSSPSGSRSRIAATTETIGGASGVKRYGRRWKL
mmetsp:Transcript_2677/g.11464  ORF Transcript_2677/g.11464 Transcript_2677/m.11464 type:complete len:368 (-) Transcript_2677:1404-2507(-)